MKTEYKTSWSIADRNDIDASIFQMLQKAMADTPLFRNKQLFFKYVILLYLGGKRRVEPFLMPVIVSDHKDEGIRYFKIKSAVAKHFGSDSKSKMMQCNTCKDILRTTKDRKLHTGATGHKHYSHIGKRAYNESIFPVDNAYELAMFQYLLQGRQSITIDFTPLLPPRFQVKEPKALIDMNYQSSLFSGITKKFNMFKMDITNGTTTIKNTGIVPHMLRHMRAYDMKVIHRYSNSFIQKTFTWKKEDMVSYYTDILNMLDIQSQVEEIKRHRLSQPIR